MKIKTKAIRKKSIRDKSKDAKSRRILSWAKKIKAIEYKENKCILCGEMNPIILIFHHTSGKEKNIAFLMARRARWSEIKNELNK